MKKRRLWGNLLALTSLTAAVIAVQMGPTAVADDVVKQVESRSLSSLGTVNVANLALQAPPATVTACHTDTSAASATSASKPTSSSTALEIPPKNLRPDVEVPKPLAETSSFTLPDPTNTSVSSSNASGFIGIEGTSACTQRDANGGNQFNHEPSDYALCVGNGYIVQAVNTAVQIWTTAGAPVTPALAQTSFFKQPLEIDRSTPNFATPGPLMGDPQCLFDPGSGRWFFLTWATEEANGASQTGTPKSFYYIGVSKTGNPTGTWNLFLLDVNTPSHPQCPCLPDHPLIGTDKYTFVVSYNEYPLRKDGFNGAQVLVMSKAKLVAGHLSPVLRITAGTIGGGLLYSMQPAQIPPGGSYNTGRNGTLFFTSAADFDGAGDTRVLMEALTNTAAINTNPLNIHVKKAQHSSLGYISPLKIEQKDGPNPLGDLVGEGVNMLDGGGDETQPTTLAAGYVWTAIDTRISGDRSGILWLQLHPSFTSTGALRFGVTHQGYVAVSGENVTYGAIAATPAGKVLIAISLVSHDRFPSTGYAFITPSTGVGAIHVASAGTEAEDGFTCYVAFEGSTATDRGCRWGDYSGAEVGTDGRFYFGAEDQSLVSPDAPFANWETSISRVNAPT